MLVSKYVQIEFADPRIRAIDAIGDIRKAAEYAGLNLYSRYAIQLQYPMPHDGRVVVEVKIPEEIVDGFAIGNHLRGISTYLLKRCDGRYDRFAVGNRLLTYTDVTGIDYRGEPTAECRSQLEDVIRFARLLERSDDEAAERIARITAILDEGGDTSDAPTCACAPSNDGDARPHSRM